MRSISTSQRAASCLCLLLLAAVSANATSYVMVADADLADQATIIAEVRVLSADPYAGAGKPVTEYMMAVERLISGYAPASPLPVRVLGGLLPDGMGLHVYAAPRFEEGERALLFLEPRDDGTYRILHFMLGAFPLVEIGGERYAIRNLSEAVEVESPGRAPVRRGPRHLDRFRSWLDDRARGIERAADYFVADVDLAEHREKFTFITSSGRPIRWREFDSGGSVRFRAHQDGQPNLAGGGFSQFQTALAVWTNDANTPIRYLYGGTTSATGGLDSFDGVNAILFDDPNDEIGTPYGCAGGGTIAIGGPWFDSNGTHNHNGTVFFTTLGGDIVTNEDTGCFFAQGGGQGASEVFAHELGHTLGLGHSCGDDSSGSCNTSDKNNALMRAQAHGGNFGAKLGTDDRAGIRELYGSALTAPAAPSGLAAGTVSSSRIDLTWSDNSTDETSFDVERQNGGGSFQQIASRGANSTSYQDTSAASGTTYTYRVRARNSAGVSGYSNTATATTSGEPAPSNLGAGAISESQILLTWQDNAAAEVAYEIEGKTDGDFSLFQTVAADSGTATVGGLMAATEYTFRVRAIGVTDNSTYSNEASATTFFSAPEPCVAGLTTLCLNGGRFKVEVNWRDFGNTTGPATDAGLPATDSGLLWFFTEDNWEMLIKVLDGCAITNHFWVFAAATTDVEYQLTVTDSVTGFQKTYDNDLGVASSAITDTEAFATCSAIPPPSLASVSRAPESVAPAVEKQGIEKQGNCVPSATRMCLNDNRFAVEIDWRDFGGSTGSGQVDPFQSADSGLQWFFNAQNLEVLVKVLDGCAINNRVWVFSAATTDVEYTLKVTDTETGAIKEYFNPLGNAASAITDTDAFLSCP